MSKQKSSHALHREPQKLVVSDNGGAIERNETQQATKQGKEYKAKM